MEAKYLQSHMRLVGRSKIQKIKKTKKTKGYDLVKKRALPL